MTEELKLYFLEYEIRYGHRPPNNFYEFGPGLNPQDAIKRLKNRYATKANLTFNKVEEVQVNDFKIKLEPLEQKVSP